MPASATTASLFRSTIAAPAALALAAGFATAGLPDVIDRVPEDSAMFIAISNVQDTLSDLAQFNANYGQSLPDEMQQGLAQVGMIGLFTSQPGVDGEGSAAVVLYPPEIDEEEDDDNDDDWENGDNWEDDWDEAGAEPDFVAVLPINDFKAFTEGPFIASQGPKINGDTMTLNMDGADVYFRDLDGFVAMGVNGQLVRDFDGAKGRHDAHEKKLGKNGSMLTEANDAVFFADVAAMRDSVEEGVSGLEQQANFAAMMGGGDQVLSLFELVKVASNGFLRDGQAGMLGINIEDNGIALDLGASFKEGSEVAGFFNNDADASELFEHVPQGDFLFAYAVDSSGDGMRKLISNIMQMNGGGKAGVGLRDMLLSSTGVGGAMGTVPAMGAGFLANTVNYVRTDNPDKAVATIGSALAEANGDQMTTSFISDIDVEGVSVPVHSFRVKTKPAAGGGGMSMMMDPAMAMAMLYGGDGSPAGYVAELDDGYVITATKNSDALRRAVAATNDGKNLAENDSISAIAGHMLPDRSAEAYVAVDQIMKSVNQIAMMFGMPMPELPKQAMNPIGISMSANHGGTATRVFLPGDVITYLAQFAEEAENGMGMGGGQQDGPRF